MELEELERKYRELGEEIERIKSKPEELWCVEATGLDSNVAYEVDKIIPKDFIESYTRQSNAFSTEIEAARMAERFNLELEISKFIKDNHGEVDWDNAGYIISHSKCRGSLIACWCPDCHDGSLKFFTRQLAQKAIDIYGDRLKFAWGITNER